VFGRYFTASQFESLLARFDEGEMLEVGEAMPASGYQKAVPAADLAPALKRLGLPDRPEARASALEFILEGLHLNKRLNKDELDGKAIFRR
jgi:magnesium chelatase subunit I